MRQIPKDRHMPFWRTFALVLLAVASVSAQEIHFVPDVDTLSLWGTCVAPGFTWNIVPVDSVTDQIVIHPYADGGLFVGQPPWGILERYDSAYFEVYDTVRPALYGLRYTYHGSLWDSVDCYLSPDSMVVSGNGQFDLTLYVYHGSSTVDTAVMRFRTYHTGLSVKNDIDRGVSAMTVGQNFPNPFNHGTGLTISLSRGAEIQVDVFDILGHRVQTVAQKFFDVGVHYIWWEPKDVSTGIYLLTLRSPEAVAVVRCALVK
jgi:hypothetical protein